jgi:PucR C-terminal helix-turn-helix domain/GGDEF-like domain
VSVEQIQALADGLAARLGRAVVVDDRELRLVAASADFGDADPARVWSLLHRKTRPEDVPHEEIARLTEPGYVPENPALELWQRLCVPVRCRGLLLGFLWITDRFGDLAQEQVAEAARTAAEIGVLLHGRLRAGGRDRERRQELVEQLLSQDAATRSEARDEVVDRGLLDDDVPAAVVLIRHSAGAGDDHSGRPHESPAAFGADVERFFLHQSGMHALTAAWPRRATVIVTGRATQQGEWLGRSVRALLGELGQAASWRIGAGGPVPGLTELPVAKRQADIALSTVGDGGVACWAELSADALLAQFPHQAWADALLPEGAARLLADPAAATLLLTLGTFLDCAGDVQRTAAELRIHRATLYNRLSRVEQVSGLNLRDGRDRLLMHLALRLHHMYGAPQRPGVATDAEERPRNPRRRAG